MSVSQPEGSHERSPLLARSQSALSTVSHISRKVRTWERSKRIIHLFMLVILLISLGDQFQESPQTRINEAVICYRYYEHEDPSKILLDRRTIGPGAIGGVDEAWCKVDAVQADLAMLRGWQLFFDGLPSLVVAIPVGWAADRVGRKPLVLVGLAAMPLRIVWMQTVTWFWQSFTIRMTWLSALFGALGGGSAMTTSLAFVVLSDVTPEADRGGVFLRIGAFNLLASLIMPPLAAWLMRYTPWIPAIGGTCLELLSVVVFAFLPETLNFPSGASSRPGTSRSNTATAFPPQPPLDPSPNQEPISLNTANQWFANLKHASAFLLVDWRIPALIVPFLIHMLVGASGQLIIQYLSARFALTFAKATLVATIRSAVMVGLLFFLLPFLSKALMHPRGLRLSHQSKDLNLARVSQIFLAVGWFAFGFASNIPLAAVTLAVASLGQGAPLLLRSFLTSLLPRDQIAIAYSVITVVDTLGAMLGSPLLAGLLKRGLSLGGSWVGLPFFFVGSLAGLFAILLFSIGLKKGEDDQAPDYDRDDDT